MAETTTEIPPSEIVEVDSRIVKCDGGPGAGAHPLVYLAIGSSGSVNCGYCDRRFVLKAGHGGKVGH